MRGPGRGPFREPVLRKPRSGHDVAPTVPDHAAARASFSWEAARRELDGLPEGRGLNVAHEAVDRHAVGPRRWQVALRSIGRDGTVRDLSYRDLSGRSSRFAWVLRDLGVRTGDRVFALTGRVPELFVAALGALKVGAVFSTLHTGFTAETLLARLAGGGARVLVVSDELYRSHVADLRALLPRLEHVLLFGEARPDADAPATRRLERLLEDADERFVVPPTDPEQPAFLHYTSGASAPPRGVLHAHRSVIAHHVTGRFALDLHPGDVYWCTAEPGWLTATAYGLVAPLTNGATVILDEGAFDAHRWETILRDQKVNVWYTTPRAIRLLMQSGDGVPRRLEVPRLRMVASVGEPLHPEAVLWGCHALGLPIHDGWSQTEAGAILVANLRSLDVKPGSFGKPLPGIEAAVLGPSGPQPVGSPGAVGELSFRTPWPSLFLGYAEGSPSGVPTVVDGWYRSGDLVRMDEDGHVWFVGRASEVVHAGERALGPFEVECVLLEHPAVAEAAAAGAADGSGGGRLAAYVALRRGVAPSEPVLRDLLAYARTRLGIALDAADLRFVSALPRTRNGKLLRRVLRARASGLPEHGAGPADLGQ